MSIGLVRGVMACTIREVRGWDRIKKLRVLGLDRPDSSYFTYKKWKCIWMAMASIVCDSDLTGSTSKGVFIIRRVVWKVFMQPTGTGTGTGKSYHDTVDHGDSLGNMLIVVRGWSWR